MTSRGQSSQTGDDDEDSWSCSDEGRSRREGFSFCAFGISSWFGRKQSEVELELRKEISSLKQENRRLRELAKSRGASIGDICRVTTPNKPLAPIRGGELRAQCETRELEELTTERKNAPLPSGQAQSVPTVCGEPPPESSLSDCVQIPQSNFGEAVPMSTNPIIIVTDAGRSLEDELTLVLLRAFAEQGLVQPQAVVANVSPALARARLTRGTLDTLGLYNVPVGVGTDGGTGIKCEDTWSASAEQYVPREQSQSAKALISGRRLLHQTFVRARETSLTLLLLSSTKDAALFFRDNTDLFRSKIKTVVFSGEAKVPGHTDGDEAQFIEPDESSPNVAIDITSAQFLFRRLQEWGVPLIVLGQRAARAAPTPRSVFDQLAELGSPIGWRLQSSQKEAIEKLWQDARCEEARRIQFLKRYCGSNDVPANEDNIWAYIEGFDVKDTLALVACVPTLREKFLMPHIHSLRGADHMCIGVSVSDCGIKPKLEKILEDYLSSAYINGITLNSNLCRPEIIVVSDPGQDLDDEMALILLRALIEEGLVNCEAVICNLQPANQRALLARGTLDCLGLQHVSVGVGSDGGSNKHLDTFAISAQHYMPQEMELIDGQRLLHQLYTSAPLGGVHLLLISSMTDAAQFVRENEHLFVQKTQSVTIMGGVEPFDTDDGLPLVPDTANNNAFDMNAARELYAQCQNLRVPLIILSRYAAYACPMPRDIYDDMAWTGHPIGLRLQTTQRQSIEGLWQRAASEDQERRMGLPKRCNKQWFCSTFCKGQGLSRTCDDSIWDLVVSFNMYDPLALMACVPDLRRRFFTCVEKEVKGVTHTVIGISKHEPGITDDNVKELRDFMYRGFFKGTTLNFSSYTKLDADTMYVTLKLARNIIISLRCKS